MREEQRGENVEEQDKNAKILIELASLRRLRSNLKEGENACRSLGKTLETIITTIANAQGALYNITSFKEEKRRIYATGLSYKDVKKLEITKDLIYALFSEPNTILAPPTNRAHISIDWCVEPCIKENWMDYWYMVFDEDLHGSCHIPLYFLRKLYTEFILGKHVNYFDILEFHGVGGVMPQHREHAQVDPNWVCQTARPQNSRGLYLPTRSLLGETQGALLQLS